MIKKKPQTRRIEIDLTGPQGNAHVLLGYAKEFGRQLEWNNEQIKAVQDRMTSGDYENLIKVFDECFGTFVTLWR